MITFQHMPNTRLVKIPYKYLRDKVNCKLCTWLNNVRCNKPHQCNTPTNIPNPLGKRIHSPCQENYHLQSPNPRERGIRLWDQGRIRAP